MPPSDTRVVPLPERSRGIRLLLLLGGALILRLLFFSGFGLGDDAGYCDVVRILLGGSYPPLDDLSVFLYRPVWLYAIAASVGILGWTDAALALPSLVASLLGIYLAYEIGRRLLGEYEGLIAGLLLATCPLDAVQATTLTNDLLVATCLAAGMTVALTPNLSPGPRAALSGLAFLLGYGTKSNAMILPVVLAAGAIVLPERRRPLLAALAGCIAAFLLLACAFWSITGDPIRNLTAERTYYATFHPPYWETGSIPYTDILLYYPRIMLGLLPGDLWSNFDYGLLLPLAILVLPWAAWKPALKFLALWLLVSLFMMEFSPARLTPDYIPIHRLARFLAVCLVPASLLAAGAIATLHRRHPATAIALTLVVVVAGLARSHEKHAVFTLAMADLRTAAHKIDRIPGRARIVSDTEGVAALRFLTRYAARFEWAVNDGARAESLPAATWYVTGGSRRIEAAAEGGIFQPPPRCDVLSEEPSRFDRASITPLRIAYLEPVLSTRGMVATLTPEKASAGDAGLVIEKVEIHAGDGFLDFEILPRGEPAREPGRTHWTWVCLLDTDGDSMTGIYAPTFGSDIHLRARFSEHGWIWAIDESPSPQTDSAPPGPAGRRASVKGAWDRDRIRIRVPRGIAGDSGTFSLSASSFAEAPSGRREGTTLDAFGIHKVTVPAR